MNYLLDKKIKRNRYIKFSLVIFIFLFLFIFRVSVFSGLSSAFSFVFKPVLILGNNVKTGILNTGAYFYSKKSLFLENENLKLKLLEQESRIVNYNSILDENLKIKEILNRKQEKSNMTLGVILAKPNQSAYDTLIIDVGVKNGITVGQRVFAFGNIPIGRIAEVNTNTSKVILFSNPGEKTEIVVSLKNAYMQVVGRGGGNFEMVLPRDFILEKGAEVVLPGIIPYLVGTVQTIISDPRDAFQKALLISPVNIQELKFVEVEK